MGRETPIMCQHFSRYQHTTTSSEGSLVMKWVTLHTALRVISPRVATRRVGTWDISERSEPRFFFFFPTQLTFLASQVVVYLPVSTVALCAVIWWCFDVPLWWHDPVSFSWDTFRTFCQPVITGHLYVFRRMNRNCRLSVSRFILRMLVTRIGGNFTRSILSGKLLLNAFEKDCIKEFVHSIGESCLLRTIFEAGIGLENYDISWRINNSFVGQMHIW